MDPAQLRLCRTLLFLPASNPRAIEKARTLAADLIVIDLEDAVKAEDKEEARKAAVEAARTGFGGKPAAIRINAPGELWHPDDLAAVRKSAADLVVVPKVQRDDQVRAVADEASKPVLAMIETAAGVLAAPAIAPCTVGLIAGTNDLSADLGIAAGAGRAGLAHSLQMVVLAARAAGVAAFDGVYNRLDDDEGLARQCEEGRSYGFDGKSLIHPSQIDTANRIFGPTAGEVEEAMRLVAAAGGGAERYQGRMIEGMHVAQAQAVLAKARR